MPCRSIFPTFPPAEDFPHLPPKVVMDLGTEPLTRCFDGGDWNVGWDMVFASQAWVENQASTPVSGGETSMKCQVWGLFSFNCLA